MAVLVVCVAVRSCTVEQTSWKCRINQKKLGRFVFVLQVGTWAFKVLATHNCTVLIQQMFLVPILVEPFFAIPRVHPIAFHHLPRM